MDFWAQILGNSEPKYAYKALCFDKKKKECIDILLQFF